MTNVQLLLLVAGVMAFLGLGYMALSGPSPAKEGARRLEALRYRHSDSTKDKVEAQLKKAVAARKPKLHHIAGSESRVAALALRLHRTGKGWTLAQYAYASVGLDMAPNWGGVCRGSPSHIVNIVGGGGVLPLITTEVARALITAARTQAA